MFEEFVTLKGKTRHGKNRINQHGTRWRVKSHGTFRGSPALSITSLDKTEGPRDKKGHDSRWVLKDNDPDFEIVEMSDEELDRYLMRMEHMEIITGRF